MAEAILDFILAYALEIQKEGSHKGENISFEKY